jgi:hypothetical protein
LRHDEPSIQPVRHTLGAVLLRADKPAEAEKAYREDLAQYPENGWPAFRPAKSIRLQGKVSSGSRRRPFRQGMDRSGYQDRLNLPVYCRQPVSARGEVLLDVNAIRLEKRLPLGMDRFSLSIDRSNNSVKFGLQITGEVGQRSEHLQFRL